jgi:hypothetical protein
MSLGAVDFRFFLVGFLGMPYALFGLIYSDPNSPKSLAAWYFYLFFGGALFLLFSALSLMDKKGVETADIVTIAILTHIALSQIHLLLWARRRYFSDSKTHGVAATNSDSIEPNKLPFG